MTNYDRIVQKLGKLNNHFQQAITLQYEETKGEPPSNFTADSKNWQTLRRTIVIVGRRRALHPQILAHEFAHIVRDKQVRRQDGHSPGFFSTYKDMCSVLNIEPKNFTSYSCAHFRATLNYTKRGHNEQQSR